MIGGRNLDGGYFVFRTTCRPIRKLGRHDIGARLRVVKCRINHARRYPFGYLGAKRRFAFAAPDRNPLSVTNAAHLRIGGVNFEDVFIVPAFIRRTPCLRAHIVLTKDTPCR